MTTPVHLQARTVLPQPRQASEPMTGRRGSIRTAAAPVAPIPVAVAVEVVLPVYNEVSDLE
jgi:hypothetical protein